MPIIDKRDRSNWHNCIPTEQDPAARWVHFSADQLKGNEIQCGCETLAKIPRMKGLISYKNKETGDGKVTRYVELITERRYDPEKKQSRNKRVSIGIDISHIYPGMMIINENYHKYFSKSGELLITPIIEERKKKEVKDKKDQEPGPGTETAPHPPESPQEEKETKQEEAKEEESMDGRDQEIQDRLNREQHMRDRFGFLDRMLNGYKYLVDEQLDRKQDRKMSRYQIRRINELLEEIRDFFQEFEYTEYLQTAEEPEGEDGERMSYSDMAVLLRGYVCVMDSYRLGKLWYKT